MKLDAPQSGLNLLRCTKMDYRPIDGHVNASFVQCNNFVLRA
jgi:hypothetical protein